ncbi:MAG: GNAT family N-acetyltransferase [Microthrixaceae bacterium]
MTTPDTRVLGGIEDDVAEALSVLLPQVSSRGAGLTRGRIESVLQNPATRVIVASMDDRIVGMALLCICTTLTGQFGMVEEVAVDRSARGNHVGVHLMVRLLEVADQLHLDFVELTSRSSREVANGLYRSLGFELRETNVYRHRLDTLPRRR